MEEGGSGEVIPGLAVPRGAAEQGGRCSAVAAAGGAHVA